MTSNTQTRAQAHKAQPRGRLADALWMWFAFLGGAVAWALHLGVVWSITEVTCSSGHYRIAGYDLPTVVAVATVAPLAVTVLAVVASTVMWRRTRPQKVDTDSPQGGRAHLLAGVGLAANLLFAAIIVFDGVALMVFPSCQT